MKLCVYIGVKLEEEAIYQGNNFQEKESMCKEVELWEPSIWENMKNTEKPEFMLR